MSLIYKIYKTLVDNKNKNFMNAVTPQIVLTKKKLKWFIVIS